jgi:hypothetical protein
MLFRARPLSRGPSVCFRSLRSHANRSAGLFRARPLALVVGAAALLSVLAPSQALAAPKDAQATKAHKAAMEEDYLESRFDDAEKKVRGALDACGESGCSKDVKAKLYMALGIVLINGKSKKDDGKQAFIDGLKLDPKAEPDPDYVTSDIKSAFDDAKKAAGSSGPSKPSSDGPISVLPVPEQKANTPVPVYVSLDEDTAKKVTSVTLSYVPTSGGDETSLELEKSARAGAATSPARPSRRRARSSTGSSPRTRRARRSARSAPAAARSPPASRPTSTARRRAGPASPRRSRARAARRTSPRAPPPRTGSASTTRTAPRARRAR